MSASPPVTFVLLAYKQEAFVRVAVEAALAQDYPDLRLLISDDCSPDRTFAVIEEVVRGYRGPHRVRTLRMPENLGLSRHLRTVVSHADGDLLVWAAGDDISAPHRTSRLVQAWLDGGRLPAVIYSDCRMINLQGEVKADRSPVMRREPPTFAEACRGILDVHGATSAATASLFTAFEPIAPDVIFEDRVLPFRALLLGGKVLFIDEALVDYRFEGGVSRLPKDAEQARVFYLTTQRRLVADARQRLVDLRRARPDDAVALATATATLVGHEINVAFAESSRSRYELLLLRNMGKPERLRPALRAYLRQRGAWLTRLVRALRALSAKT